MSTPRHGWWSYVKYMIRIYPEHLREYSMLHDQTITQNLNRLPTHNRENRVTERISIRELPGTKMREFEAVHRAVELTKNAPHSGQLRLSLINLVFWQQSHTLEGAAFALNCSYRTARRYQSDFIYLVAKNYGLMDE